MEGIGEVSTEHGPLCPVYQLADAVRAAEHTSVDVHPHDDHVLDSAFLEQRQEFVAVVRHGVAWCNRDGTRSGASTDRAVRRSCTARRARRSRECRPPASGAAVARGMRPGHANPPAPVRQPVGPLGALAGGRTSVVLHATRRCMNDQSALLSQPGRDVVDARGHLDDTPCRRHTLCGVPHVADDHCDPGVVPVEALHDDGHAVGGPGPERHESDSHAARMTSGGLFGPTPCTFAAVAYGTAARPGTKDTMRVPASRTPRADTGSGQAARDREAARAPGQSRGGGGAPSCNWRWYSASS